MSFHTSSHTRIAAEAATLKAHRLLLRTLAEILVTEKITNMITQCDGRAPCSTCTKRHFECTYLTSDRDPHYDTSPSQSSATKKRPTGSDGGIQGRFIPNHETPLFVNYSSEDVPNTNHFYPIADPPSIEHGAQPISHCPVEGDMGSTARLEPDMTPQDGAPEEEADNHTMTRMLEDGKGHLCEYISPSFELVPACRVPRAPR